jgi:metallophosphoesterase (TIGR03767 family)
LEPKVAHQKRFEFKRELAANGYTRTSLSQVQTDDIHGKAPEEPVNLATFIHLSDLHLCDAKSPARVEFLDRYADPDYPTRAQMDYVGTYRPQEFLTLQVVEAMVQAANSIEVGPLMGGKIDAVLITGDVIDNGQENELSWYKQLMDGGPVSSGSGDSSQVEAAHGSHPNFLDDHYYKPDAARGNRVDELWGIGPVPGLAAAAQEEFAATGLRHKWLAIHGNHDALLQGTVRPDDLLQGLVTGDRKLSGIIPGADLNQVFEPFQEVGPADYPSAELLTTVEVSPDASRRFVAMEDWVGVHTNCGHDHGLDEGTSVAYWVRDFGEVRVIALDTVNEWGGWQGCLDVSQFNWLSQQLESSKDKYVVLTSHHPLQDLFNGYAPEWVEKPVLKDRVERILSEYPNVIAWISGHVHDHNISFKRSDKGNWGFWQIRTGSHMDWPQQSRVVEIARSADGRIAIGTMVFDHAGAPILDLSSLESIDRNDLDDPILLAGVSRILAANDWQRFEGYNSLEALEGKPEDRNTWLWLFDPLA